MRNTWSLSTASCLLTLTMAVPLCAQSQETNPCGQVESACKKAGFAGGESKEGKGLWADCIEPIMQGRQIKGITLPKVSPQVVAACKAKDPSFGEPGKSKPKPKQ